MEIEKIIEEISQKSSSTSSSSSTILIDRNKLIKAFSRQRQEILKKVERFMNKDRHKRMKGWNNALIIEWFDFLESLKK